jgi:hypothetical protein
MVILFFPSFFTIYSFKKFSGHLPELTNKSGYKEQPVVMQFEDSSFVLRTTPLIPSEPHQSQFFPIVVKKQLNSKEMICNPFF